MPDRENDIGYRVTTLLLGACAFSVCLFIFLQIREATVRQISESAENEFGGEPVSALIAKAISNEIPLRERNRAVRALGELRDPRALPTLQELNVQEECDHSRIVCQREVRKAIKKINGEMSLDHTLKDGLKKLKGRMREDR